MSSVANFYELKAEKPKGDLYDFKVSHRPVVVRSVYEISLSERSFDGVERREDDNGSAFGDRTLYSTVR